MSGRFNTDEFFAKIGIHPKRVDSLLFLFLCSLLILAYIVPTCVNDAPYGTDVYTHLFYTREMARVNSLSDFYDTCFEKSYLVESYDYPFGLRLFGSIVAKVTGVDMLTLSILQPFVILIVLIMLYYPYARVFKLSREQAILSVVLLLSMPIISLYILGYETDNFVLPFLMAIMYFIFVDDAKLSIPKRFIFVFLFILCLCFSHTGTYMFLMMFFIISLLAYAVLYGIFHRNSYIAIIFVLFNYILTMQLFPYIHPQYIDKGRILVSVGEFISSNSHLPFISELAEIFYEQIFVNLNPLYVGLWCLSLYAMCRALIFVRLKLKVNESLKKTKTKLSEKFFSIPVIGGIQHISHSVLYWPFWLGPVHVILTVVGILKTNKKGICMLLSLAIVTLLPGFMAGERGTREIWYLFLILPLLAVLGFYHIKQKIEYCTEKNKLQKIVIGIVLLGFFSSLIVPPVIGNMYYNPIISGTKSEISSLHWLSEVGTPGECCAGPGYRYMISIYGDKINPGATSTEAGSESRRFSQDFRKISLYTNSEEYADDLYATFGVKYLIISDRVLSKGLGVTEKQLRTDYNKQLDKIYSSADFFSFYRYIPPVIQRTSITPPVSFADTALIKDAGGSYVIETDEYKVRLSKATPQILNIENKTTNYLGDGGAYDYILITWSGPRSGQVNGYVLQELNYPWILLGDNQIIYETVLKDKNGIEDWATLSVKYTFFDKAMKREIIIANDWANNSGMNARVTMVFLSPMNHFSFQNENNPTKARTIYPSEDAVPLTKIKLNKIFINESKEGIYIFYGKTAPYPNSITYSGLIRYLYEYYSLDTSAEKSLSTSETMQQIQWISTGDEETAKNNVEYYTSVSLYPYPNGEIPMILTSHIGSLNDISEEEFIASLAAHDKLKDEGVADYTEAMSMQDMELSKGRMSDLLERGACIIGSEDIEGFNSTVQQEKIGKMKENAQKYDIELNGVMPEDLRYDLDTISVLAEHNMTFIIAKRILPPIDIYYQEGIRQPQMTYYHSKETGVVLLPISEPILAGPTYYYDDYSEAWKAVIDSVIKNDELCVFLWDSDKACNLEYINDTIGVINYAKERGMTFTTPYKVANHFALLQNVSAVVSRAEDDSKIAIRVSNDNEEAVHGVTFRVALPRTAEYVVNNGQIVRKDYSASGCSYYVSTDLASKESKEIVLDVPGYR